MAHSANDRPDIVDAISLLSRERDISEEMLLSTVEEACKAAFRKNCKNGGAPMNLSVVIARKKPGAESVTWIEPKVLKRMKAEAAAAEAAGE